MKMVRRPRYYCDFCKKAGGSRWHMEQHEKHCTGNPERWCRLCSLLGDEAEPLPDLIQIALTGDVDKLREAAGKCAACMLAAIRQAPWPKVTDSWEMDGKTYTTTYEPRSDAINHWSFKDELAASMRLANDLGLRDEHSYY